MSSAEIGFERIHGALESTRGTAITTPTHSFNLMGLITAGINYYEPKEARGKLRRIYRQKISRKGATFTAQGPVEVNYFAWWLNMYVKAVTSPSTPSGATLTRLWEFVPTLTADDIKAASLIWDWDIQSLISDFCMARELTLTNDANAESDGLNMMVSGIAGFPADIATPTPAANLAGDILVGQQMQAWLDTSSAIGTTALANRLIKAEHKITTGVEPKHFGQGPAAALDYTDIGRNPDAVRCVTKISLETPDTTEYDHFTAGTTVKLRVRHNGDLIETTAGPVNWYNYVEVDTYGVLKFDGWGENAGGANRIANYTVESIEDSTLSSDFRVAVQNARTTL